jgi:AcrR family transcriptional regulator
MRNGTKPTKAPERRGRGRPRAFDPEVALGRAREVFWDAGYAASSLDELSEAMQLNRPSVYAAFGDKEALYLETLGRYRDSGADAMVAALDPKRPLKEGVRAVYAGALALYFANKPAPRGCLLIGTAATEAVRNPKVRDVLGKSLLRFDELFEERFEVARETGEIARNADPAMLARLASSVMFSLAVRARAGESRRSLEALADAGAELVCGAGSSKAKRRPAL